MVVIPLKVLLVPQGYSRIGKHLTGLFGLMILPQVVEMRIDIKRMMFLGHGTRMGVILWGKVNGIRLQYACTQMRYLVKFPRQIKILIG